MPIWLTGLWGKMMAAGAVLVAILLAALSLEKKGETVGKAKIQAADQKISASTAQKVQDARSKVASGTAAQARADLAKNDIDPNA